MSETPPVNLFQKTKAATRRASALAIIAILLAVAVAIGTAITWKQLAAVSTIVSHYSADNQQQTKQSIGNLTTTTKQLNTSLQSVQQQVGDLEKQLHQLSYANSHAQFQRQLDQAAYLIHMANLQIVINRNIDAALRLLKAAEIKLNAITSNQVLSLKKAVENAIGELENTPDVDVARLLAQIEQLKMSIQNLPAMPTQKAAAAVTPPKPSDNNAHQPWYKKLTKSLSSLKDLIIIRHEKNPIKPMLAPQQLLFLKENVQLKLSETEWAILHQDTAVYQQSLASAKTLLLTHYPNQEAMTEPLKTIEALTKIDINPKLPDLSETLKTLSDVKIEPTASHGEKS